MTGVGEIGYSTDVNAGDYYCIHRHEGWESLLGPLTPMIRCYNCGHQHRHQCGVYCTIKFLSVHWDTLQKNAGLKCLGNAVGYNPLILYGLPNLPHCPSTYENELLLCSGSVRGHML